jgi:hypothetical protein
LEGNRVKKFLLLSLLLITTGNHGLLAQELYLVKDEFELNQTTLRAQYDPALATNGFDRLVATWYSKGQDDPDSTEDKGIFARLFDFSGNPLTDEFQVNSTTFLDQDYPNVDMASDGSFVITWRGEEPVSPRPSKRMYDIFAQRFDADGSKIGDEFRVNTTTTNIQEQPNVGIADDGSLVIIWKSFHADQTGDIFFQRYAADGTPQGTETQANTYFFQRQEYPDIFMQPNGNFVLCWRGFDSGIKTRIFNANGVPLVDEIQVDTFTQGSSARPKIAGIPNSSSFMIAWSNSVVDGSYSGVLAQRFFASGAKNGAEFIVNTTTEGVQNYPSLDVFPDSSFVIAYDSYGHDEPGGTRSGIYFKYYSSPENILIDETLANNFIFDNQQHNQILVLNNDLFSIAWNSAIQDADSSSGVFAKIYSRKPIQAVDASPMPITDFRLRQNYPNPFNPTTTIRFALKQTAVVQLCVYNVNGELVDELLNRRLNAGTYETQWEAADFASGVYFYQLQAGQFSARRKMILMH